MKTAYVWLRWLVVFALAGAQVLAPIPAQAGAGTNTTLIPGALYDAFLNSTASAAAPFHQAGNSFSLLAHGLQTQLNPAGFALSPSDGSRWNWNLQLDGFGRGSHPAGVSSPQVSAKNGRIIYAYSGLTQWVRNTGIGVEQGFTVGQSPSGSGGLVLQMTLNTSLPGKLSQDGRSLAFDAGNGTALRYANLRAFDARGTELAAKLVYSSNRIMIQVDDHSAVYPLTIDPLIFLQTKLTAPDGVAFDQFGESVAVSGNTAVVGANMAAVNGHASQGAAYVFVLSNGTWIQQAKLTASDGAAGDEFGISVAISGNTVLVGAELATVGGNVNQGTAYIFVRSGTTWTQQKKLIASDGTANYYFGISVSISNNTLVVSALYNAFSFGKVYVFQRSGTVWSQKAILTASDTGAFDEFGYSIAVSGNTVLVGGPARSTAYVFVMPGGGWANATETARLTASDAATGFAGSVAISGNTAVVGAGSATVGANASQGEAFIFVMPGGGWTNTTENARLTASDGKANAFFGSVAISGNSVLVGAYNANAAAGEAYVFVEPGSGWSTMTENARLTASDGQPGDFFGGPVGISGGTAVVGAYAAGPAGHHYQGAAYMFEQDNTYDLDVHAAAGKTDVLPGDKLAVSFSARNYGPATAAGVVLSISLPAGFTYNSNSATLGSYNHATGLWNVGTLAPYVTATLNLQLTALGAAAGTTRVFKATSLISDNDNSNNIASLNVIVSPLTFTPLASSFGSQLAGTAGAAHTVTARNLGAAALKLGTLSISPGFLLLSNTCNGKLLAHNATCSFGVKFSPAAAMGYAGAVTVPHNGLGASSSMALTGMGLAGWQLLTNTSFETATLKVPNGWVKVGTWAPADGQDTTVKRSGTASLKFTGNNVLKALTFTRAKSGIAGDDFRLLLYSQAAAVPIAGTTYSVTLRFFNGPTLVGSTTANFAKGTHAFSAAALAFSAPATYTQVQVLIQFKASSGTAWFDDASLFWAP